MSYFTRPTRIEIYERMKADAEERFENTNWISRSLVLVIIATVASGFYLMYGFLIRLADQLFFTTADDFFVKWYGRKYGIPRKAAEFATCTQYRFYGVAGTTILEGTEVQDTTGIAFDTDDELTVGAGGYVDATLTCTVSGTQGNISASVLTLVTPIIDINSEGDVLGEIGGGVDMEEKDDHIVRLLQRTQNPPGSGNKTDYERWALEVAGVGRAWCKSAEEWLGAGTVGVLVATGELQDVGAAVLSNVDTYIRSVRPEGSSLTVLSPTFSRVIFEIDIYPNTPAVQSEIDTAIQKAYYAQSEPGETFFINDVRKAISSTSVVNYYISQMIMVGPIATAPEDKTPGATELFYSSTNTYGDF